jgi:hypothetical protein
MKSIAVIYDGGRNCGTGGAGIGTGGTDSSTSCSQISCREADTRQGPFLAGSSNSAFYTSNGSYRATFGLPILILSFVAS